MMPFGHYRNIANCYLSDNRSLGLLSSDFEKQSFFGCLKFAKARAERCLHQLCRAQLNSDSGSSLQEPDAVIASGSIIIHTSQHFLSYMPKIQNVTECMPVFGHTLCIHRPTLCLHQPAHQQEMQGSLNGCHLLFFCFPLRNTLFLNGKQKISALNTFESHFKSVYFHQKSFWNEPWT